MNLIQKIQNKDLEKLKLFGITICKKVKYKDGYKLKILGGLFKKKVINQHKKIYILGIQVYCKKIQIPEKINYSRIATMQQRLITTALLHQKTFSKYENKHVGQEIVLVGSGPTCKYYQSISDNMLHIALNSAFRKPNIKFNYVFMQDYEACSEYINEIPTYVNKDCKLFYGYTWLWAKKRAKVIPNSIALKHHAERYFTNVAFDAKPIKNDFTLSIDSEPLFCGGSVAFPAMQFALWTNPQRIYLVGCDCSTGHFDNTPFNDLDGLENLTHLINKWINLKKFVECYYPNTEIISVNPVGLKGLFRDVYTKSYVSANPELFENADIEYLEDINEEGEIYV